MGYVTNFVSFVLEKISLVITSVNKILPSTKIFGFLDLMTLILLVLSLIIVFIIFKTKYVGLRAFNWGSFFIWWAIVFLILKFL